jgi:hypothetical protein
MRRALLCIAVLFSPVVSHGTQDLIAPWTEVSVVATVDGVLVRGEAKTHNDKITLLSMEVKGRKIIVPVSEYADIRFPQLHTFKIIYSPKDAKEPWGAAIALYYGDTTNATDNSDLNDAVFGFSDNKYEQRWTRERVSADTWQHYRKLPGESVEKMGVERVIGSVK